MKISRKGAKPLSNEGNETPVIYPIGERIDFFALLSIRFFVGREYFLATEATRNCTEKMQEIEESFQPAFFRVIPCSSVAKLHLIVIAARPRYAFAALRELYELSPPPRVQFSLS